MVHSNKIGITCFVSNVQVTDLAGGTNFIILSVVTWSLGASENDITVSNECIRTTICNILVLSWGFRLSAFLFYRIIMIHEDKRFDGLREDPIKFLGFWIFQMFWVYTVSLPLIFINGQAADVSCTLGPADYICLCIAVVGLVVETAADQIKFNFK